MWGFRSGFLASLSTVNATPLLDALAHTPIGAWTMDLERAAYAGSGIRVRNATTNTETDIGFSGGVSNNAAMATALGTDGGTVSKWYNQVSGGPDAVQSTGDAQPVIPSLGGGAYVSAMTFSRAGFPVQGFSVSIAPGATTQWMCTFVSEFNGDSTYGVLASYDAGAGDTGTGGARIAHGFGTGIAVDQSGAEGYKLSIAPGYHTVTTYTDGANIGVYVDGVAGTSVACGTTIGASGTLNIGRQNADVSNPWAGGALKALIFWNTYSNSDRLLAEAWLRSKYGTP